MHATGCEFVSEESQNEASDKPRSVDLLKFYIPAAILSAIIMAAFRDWLIG